MPPAISADEITVNEGPSGVPGGVASAGVPNWRTVVAVTTSRIVATGSPVDSTATAVSELLCGSIPIVIMHSLPSRDRGDPATGTLTSRSVHASVEPRHGRATASSTLCEEPARKGGKEHPSQPAIALGTLWAADPAA